LLSPFVSINWVSVVVPLGWVTVDVWDWMIRWTMGMLAPGLRRKSREEEIEV
jgi:hypothetical protein